MTKRKHSERAEERHGARSPAELHEQLALLAAQVRSLGERLAGDPSPPAPVDPPAQSSASLAELASRSVERVIASAEQAAVEIRSRAEREAREIRARAQRYAHGGELAEHQRLALAGLIEDAERVSRDAATLVTRARTLLAEGQTLTASPRRDA